MYKVIESLDDVEVNEFEREVLSENFISMRNVKAGEFIIEFNRLHGLVNCLCTGIGIDMNRARSLRMALRSLYNESIINEYELEELENISTFRNSVVHGTQSIEEDKLEESFDKIRKWSAVIETKIGACRKEKIRALEIMEDVFKRSNVVRYDRANREKINEDNIYCVMHKSQGLLNEYTRMLSEITDVFELNDRDTFLGIKMLDNNMFGSLKSYLNSHSWEDMLNCYIIKLMNDCNGGVIEELNGKELDFYLDYIKEKDILELYRRLVDYQVKKSIGEMYGEDAVNGDTAYDAEISILINNSDWMHYKYIVDCLQALKSIRAFLEENEIYIDIKIFMKDDGYITSHLLEEFESNILSLKWSKIEIRDSVLGALFEAMEELHERQISLFDRTLTDDVDDSKKLSLFWGKNAVDGERDISMMDYFCENLERIGRFNVVDASRILVEAMEIEKSKDLDIMNGKVVSQSSLKKAFEAYLRD